MVVLLFSILLLSIYVSTNKIYKNVINPITIFFVPHLVSIILLLGSNYTTVSISLKTYTIFFASLFLYASGALFSKKFRQSRVKIKFSLAKWITPKRFIGVISVVVDFAFIVYTISLQKKYGIINAVRNLNVFNEWIQTYGLPGFFNYIFPLAIPLSMSIQYYLRNNIISKHKWRYVLQFIICFLPFISARRQMFFLAAVANTVFFFLDFNVKGKKRIEIHKEKKKRKMVFGIIIIALILFFIRTQTMLKKNTMDSITFIGVAIPTRFSDIYGYLAGNYAYFELYSQHNYFFEMDSPFIATFRIFYLYLLPLFGINIDAISSFQLPFLNLGYGRLFNTIPIQYYFIKDLGIIGILEVFIMGAIANKLFDYKNKSLANKMKCAFVFSVIFWSFREYDLIILNYWIITAYILFFSFIENA